MKNKLYLLLFCTLMPIYVLALDCNVCNKAIKGKYLQANNKSYCSEKCFDTTLEKCSHCKSPCKDGSMVFMGKNFCSQKCMNAVYKCAICQGPITEAKLLNGPNDSKIFICKTCSQLPPCFFCSLPFPTKTLDDQRNICKNCEKGTINNPADIQKLFQSVRNDLQKLFNYDSKHKIDLRIVDKNKLAELGNNIYTPSANARLALMRYFAEVTEETDSKGNKKKYISHEKCQVFILSHTPKELLLDAIAHELTHDYLRHKLGNLKDLQLEEGFCELVSSLYNQKIGHDYLNERKLTNQDPIYGDGYRKILKIYQENNQDLSKVLQFLQ